MDKCSWCKRKSIGINCMWCSSTFCPKCIQLEIHECKKISDKIENERKIIQSKNKVICSEKLKTKV